MGLPFELHYEAPVSCPHESVLRDEIAARLPAEMAPLSVDVRRFGVRIVERPAGTFSAVLELSSATTTSTRELHEPTCAHLVRSLAVIIAIAADPLPEPPSSRPATPPRPPPARRAPVPRRVQPAPALPPLWQWSAGATVGFQQAAGTFSGARVHGQLRHLGPSPLAWAMRLSWGFAERSARVAGEGRGWFRLRTARLEACASYPTSWIEPALCPAVDLGTLSARTSGLPQDGTATTRWLALGLVGRSRFPLGAHVALELQLALFAPLRRPEFVLAQPERLVYRAPHLAVETQTGLSVVVVFP